MDVRLVQLLGSFITARSDYALTRLECAMQLPDYPAAPVIDRLNDASEQALRDEWPAIERQLDVAVAYGKRAQRAKGTFFREAGAFRALERSLREMDQYARAIRWVMAVTESEDV